MRHHTVDLNRLRVLTFTTLYPNEAQPNHGVFVENRLRHLVETGRIAARVVAPVPWFPFHGDLFGQYAAWARAPQHEARHGIPIEHPRYVVIPKIGMSVGPRMLFKGALPFVRRLHVQHDFDLIDAHYFYPDGVAAVHLGTAIGRPVVITARGTDVNLIPRHPIARRQILYAADRAAGIVAVSEALKTALVELGISGERVTVLRNGVDLKMFTPDGRDEARATLRLIGKTLLSVGHLIERKGHDLIVKALPQLKDYQLVIAGGGPEWSRLRALADRLGVAERVLFPGEVPHRELQRFYAAADALVLASSREGWPNVLLEAMACGTPVIASNIWGNPEVVSQPEAGVLMRSRTPEAIVEAVETLFNRRPERTATRAYAEQFSWDATSAGQLEVFENMTSSRRAVGDIASADIP